MPSASGPQEERTRQGVGSRGRLAERVNLEGIVNFQSMVLGIPESPVIHVGKIGDARLQPEIERL